MATSKTYQSAARQINGEMTKEIKQNERDKTNVLKGAAVERRNGLAMLGEALGSVYRGVVDPLFERVDTALENQIAREDAARERSDAAKGITKADRKAEYVTAKARLKELKAAGRSLETGYKENLDVISDKAMTVQGSNPVSEGLLKGSRAIYTARSGIGAGMKYHFDKAVNDIGTYVATKRLASLKTSYK